MPNIPNMEYDPAAGLPPRDGIGRIYDHPQDYSKGWNRREQLDERKIGENWPFKDTCTHRFLGDVCSKCGFRKES